MKLKSLHVFLNQTDKWAESATWEGVKVILFGIAALILLYSILHSIIRDAHK